MRPCERKRHKVKASKTIVMIWLSQIKWVVIQFWTLIWYVVLNSLKVISSKHSATIAAAAAHFFLLLSYSFPFNHTPNGFLLFHPSFFLLYVIYSFQCLMASSCLAVKSSSKLTQNERETKRKFRFAYSPRKKKNRRAHPPLKTFHFENWDFIKFPNDSCASGLANLKYAHNWKDIECHYGASKREKKKNTSHAISNATRPNNKGLK